MKKYLLPLILILFLTFTLVGNCTPWDISTAVYSNKSDDVSNEVSVLQGATLSADGSKMYVVDYTTTTIYQYTLGTPWDMGTSSYASKSKDMSNEDDQSRSVIFKPDGNIMYYLGTETASVYQYTLSSAWDVTTASYASKFDDVSNEIASPRDFFLSSDGSKMYVTGGSSNTTVWQYTLGTPWDMGTSSYASKSDDVSDECAVPHSFTLSADGSKMYVMDYTPDIVYQYTLGTPWDMGTSSYASKSKDVSNEEVTTYCVLFSADGSKMYIGGSTNNTMFQYTLPAVEVQNVMFLFSNF